MNIHNLPEEEVLNSLLTSTQGLSDKEARRRLHEYGLNTIEEVRKKPLLRRFVSQFTHFLAILLWVAAALCFLSEYLRPGEGMLSLGLAIIAVIFINATFTFIQEYRAEKAVEELKRLLPFHVKVLRDGFLKEIPAAEVVPGDIFLINEGDRVPADARLLESSLLMVNNAPLTGESEFKPRSHEPYDGSFLESPNVVFAGTLIVSGSGKAVAFATGMSTEFGKIAHLTSAVEAGLSPLQREIRKVSRIVAIIAVTLGIIFFAIGGFIGRGFWQNFLFAVGIIIANVPEGLLPTVTLSLAMGSQRMAKKKALIKTLTSVETLGSVTVICTDKTGTLTQNKMTVVKTWTFSDGIISLPDGTKKKTYSFAMLMRIGLLCNNAFYENGIYKGDPTETAILKAARELLGDIKAERVSAIPFDSERKRMTTVNVIGNETFVLTKGAFETLLPLCDEIVEDNRIIKMSDEDKESLTRIYHSFMEEGLRVLAFAFKKTNAREAEFETEKDLVFTGFMGLEDPPRPEVPVAVAKCHDAGIKVIMITGDASKTAVAVARQVGIIKYNPVVLEGQQIDKMSDRSLRELLSSKEIIFARVTPRHKMRIVAILKDEGERVAVTGDGVNDAPALKKADIGIAMGIAGTDVAKEASDIILLDDNFATIINAIEEGRAVFENIRKFVSYIFASNIPEIVPYIAYVLFRIPLPLTILQILAIDLGTDMFPALALGAEKPSPAIMKQPPRSSDERLLSFKILSRAYFFLGPIEAFAGLYGFFYVLKLGGWQWGEMLLPHDILYIQATTACLGAIIITQIGNVFACRSFKESVFRLGLFTNKLVLLGIAMEILISFFIIYHPFGNKIFGTAPLNPDVWLVLLPFSILLLAAEEIRKVYVRIFL
ncbi:MAG: cation-transporting P-type ATPase [Nitrospirota bacterium]